MREVLFFLLILLSILALIAFIHRSRGSLIDSSSYNEKLDEFVEGRYKRYFAPYFMLSLVGALTFLYGGIQIFLFWMPISWGFGDGDAYVPLRTILPIVGAMYLMSIFFDGIQRTGTTVYLLEKEVEALKEEQRIKNAEWRDEKIQLINKIAAKRT